ncbi:RAMP superfamily CRISPR-associated protein [Heliophilum fasciatum]|uniref:CRISPR-associated Csx7 family protein n=1 Tax=Heliophilum fasciatum TaxID=35700 RepID=A0A4R2RAV2_9FIRM|nr:RAMP superfamily CRISPR-associated protein [Heliophilum fasciatum]MCW2279307.1 CRISPR-associated RAMP protein (TIGR02581 family) [Heliophilum fasciatum]TCP60432.1 CRISPR-associated Csx7 family protein [Heliophilum fasciatum]
MEKTFELFDFSKLQNRLVFSIELKLKTPLHIGGNDDGVSPTDMPILRLPEPDGRPYIPGSSLKGMLRSASERLYHLIEDTIQDPMALTVGENGQYTTSLCYLENGDCSVGKGPQDKTRNAEIIKNTLMNKSLSEKEKYKIIYRLVCPSCRTYGAGSMASKVRVHHVVLDDNTQVRDGIRIDRETGAVAPQAKFDYEYVEAGQTITLRIEGENMDQENEAILALALLQLKNNMLRLGGLQARGLGELQYVSGVVKRINYNHQNRKELLEMLLLDHDGLQATSQTDMENSQKEKGEFDSAITLECYLREALGGYLT